MRCSYYVHADIEQGDSGGPVFYYDTNAQTATATGIMFAKMNSGITSHYGVFSKMMYVRSEIQSGGSSFSILGDLSPPTWVPSATIYGVSTMQPNASCYWYVSANFRYSTVTWSVNGSTVGSNWDLTYSSGSSFLLEVQVTDGTHTAMASKSITVSSEASTCYIE